VVATTLRADSLEHDNYIIHPDWRLTSDHTFLTVDIFILDKNYNTRKQMIVKNSEEEEHFLNKLIIAIKNTDSDNIQSKEALKLVIQSFANHMNSLWYKHSKGVNMSGTVHTRNGSLQSELGDVQTCRTTLASAYVLHCLSTTWPQLQMEERSLRRK